MKVKMLKRHMQHSKNDVIEVNDNLGTYWAGCGVAERVTETPPKSTQQKEKKTKGETKELKLDKETK